MQRANEEYFISLCLKNLGDNLLYVVNTDSYIRQPCYSSKGMDFYYIILERQSLYLLENIKYIQAEFPEFILNFLTKEEINNYPLHSRWQFIFSKIAYRKNNAPLQILTAKKEDHLEALCQAIIGIGHIARHYFLRDLDSKNHTWAVRQLGWALRYTEYGVVNLWNYIGQGVYGSYVIDKSIAEEVEWLLSINKNWQWHEKIFLEDVNIYKSSSLKLNKIIQFFSKLISGKIKKMNCLESKDRYSDDDSSYDFIMPLKNELEEHFSSDIKAFYLSGSSARGDQHAGSDIDIILVFFEITDSVLLRLRDIMQNHKNVSAYTLSVSDLKIYPEFRYYTLNEGTKKIFGEISFLVSNPKERIIDSILNNLFTILQIVRSYLLACNYGHRSVHMLKLMIKLADHGCMRPFLKYISGIYPDKKEEVRSAFINDKYAVQVMEFIIDINNNIGKIEKNLLLGNIFDITEAYKILDNFVKDFLERLTKNIHRLPYNKVEL